MVFWGKNVQFLKNRKRFMLGIVQKMSQLSLSFKKVKLYLTKEKYSHE